MLLTAAAYAGAGHLQIPFVIAAAAIGAIAGDNLGYLAGRTGGRGLVEKYGGYIRLDAGKLAIAERYFEKHGDKTVFLGRFIAVLRAWAAFLAGLNKMAWPKFLFFNATGGITWAVIIGVVAFKLGQHMGLLHRVITGVGLFGLVAVGVAIVAFYVFRRRRSQDDPQVRTVGSEDAGAG